MVRVGLHDQNLGWRISLGILVLTATAGCWQKIEYTGSDPPARSAASPAVSEDTQAIENGIDAAKDTKVAARSFGQDLAESLTRPPAAPSVAAETSAAPSLDDNYAIAAGDAELSELDELPANAAELDSPPATTGTLTSTSAIEATTTDIRDPSEIAAGPNSAQPNSPEFHSDPETARTRLAAWQLGSRLSLAALAHDRGIAADNVEKWLAESRSLAVALETRFDELPESSAAAESRPASRAALNYLFLQGQQIGRDLATRHGPGHAALFEVAVKSNLLLVLYQPGSSATEAIAAAIAQASPRSQLAADLWQPVLDGLSADSNAADVRQVVYRFHANVERHLAQAVER